MRLVLLAAVALGSATGYRPPATRDRLPVAELRTRNVVLIVTDGLRWQEVFGGADSALLRSRGVSDTTALVREYWRATPAERRRALLPFVWDSLAVHGRLFGDRRAGSHAAVTNGLKFSYPGYHELIAGWPDPRLNSNEYGPNPNTTVFGWLAGMPAYRGRVSAFATWDAFADIFARRTSGVRTFAGWEDPFPSPRNDAERMVSRLYATSIRLWSNNSFDGLLQAALLEHVRRDRPRVLFVGYGETDEWAHAGRYDMYLQAARRVDGFIAELWRTMQSMPQYRGRTTFIVTTDHGRGDGDEWRNHGERVAGAEHIWIGVLGPDTPAGGAGAAQPVTQAQVAATVAALLGEDWNTAEPRAARTLPVFAAP